MRYEKLSDVQKAVAESIVQGMSLEQIHKKLEIPLPKLRYWRHRNKHFMAYITKLRHRMFREIADKVHGAYDECLLVLKMAQMQIHNVYKTDKQGNIEHSPNGEPILLAPANPNVAIQATNKLLEVSEKIVQRERIEQRINKLESIISNRKK